MTMPASPTDTSGLGNSIQSLLSAIASGNSQAAQEAIREFNLNYTNSTAQQYGQNFGVGQPAPAGVPTLAAGQATGAIGYIPGVTGTATTDQTLQQASDASSQAATAAGLTGYFAAPKQSQFQPGTFLRADPSTYDTSKWGSTLLYQVSPTGQLTPVTPQQASAMGWNGNINQTDIISAQQAVALQNAPPTSAPVQTLAGLTGYSNLNTAAQNSAIAQAGATGMYQAPSQIMPPGTNMGGGQFSSLPQQIQQNYYLANGSDWNAAMTAWVNDSNAAITGAAGKAGAALPNQPGTPQETLAAQSQYATQANQMATQFGQYYQPLTPGQTGVAGVNNPNVGQLTQSEQQQLLAAYGYIPQIDPTTGQPIAAPGSGTAYGTSPSTLGAQQQAYTQQMGVITAAAALNANPFQQAQVLGQAGRVLAGQPTASFSAPNTVQGVGTAGGLQAGSTGMGYLQQMIDDIRDPTANQTTAQSWLDNTPTPNKLDSVSFMQSSPTTQNLILQSMQQKYGIDPTDATAQIKATMPQFNAPNTLGTVGNR